MPQLRRPTDRALARLLDRLAAAGPDYPCVGRTLAAARGDGFDRDRYEGSLGKGRATFERACAGLASFAMMPRWVRVHPPSASVRAGADVLVIVRVCGLWWANPTRVVAVVREHGERERFGFLYGTLPGHAERGEERFLVTWNRFDDQVTYEILADSRPRHWLVRLFRPLARRLQRRFGRDSIATLQRFVAAAANGATKAPRQG